MIALLGLKPCGRCNEHFEPAQLHNGLCAQCNQIYNWERDMELDRQYEEERMREMFGPDGP